MKNIRSFASDNNSGVHPKILEAITRANVGHCVAYGDDPFTQEAIQKFKNVFGSHVEVFFVFNGTGANVLALSSLLKPFQAVICSQLAHIHVDECGAPEKLTQSKLLTVPAPDGKLTASQIQSKLVGIGDQHHVQPKVISISQSTELGTVYTLDELRAITTFAHSHGLLVHMDGARIANAAASLNVSLKQMTCDVGIDVLCFGGTKNGILGGEAVVFFNPEHASDFKFIRKQNAQLSSKMRFIAAQFSELLTDELWFKNASHSNHMARLLEKELKNIPSVKITQKVDANGVFAKIPPELAKELKKHYFFYTWDEAESVVRWMTSFDTTEEDVHGFVKVLRVLCSM
jgi:threonine aldolase